MGYEVQLTKQGKQILLLQNQVDIRPTRHMQSV